MGSLLTQFFGELGGAFLERCEAIQDSIVGYLGVVVFLQNQWKAIKTINIKLEKTYKHIDDSFE